MWSRPSWPTCAMSQTVTRGSRAARSKQCTRLGRLRARVQSPQPKSATTREAGLRGGDGKLEQPPHTRYTAWPLVLNLGRPR